MPSRSVSSGRGPTQIPQRAGRRPHGRCGYVDVFGNRALGIESASRHDDRAGDDGRANDDRRAPPSGDDSSQDRGGRADSQLHAPRANRARRLACAARDRPPRPHVDRRPTGPAVRPSGNVGESGLRGGATRGRSPRQRLGHPRGLSRRDLRPRRRRRRRDTVVSRPRPGLRDGLQHGQRSGASARLRRGRRVCRRRQRLRGPIRLGAVPADARRARHCLPRRR